MLSVIERQWTASGLVQAPAHRRRGKVPKYPYAFQRPLPTALLNEKQTHAEVFFYWRNAGFKTGKRTGQRGWNRLIFIRYRTENSNLPNFPESRRPGTPDAGYGWLPEFEDAGRQRRKSPLALAAGKRKGVLESELRKGNRLRPFLIRH